MRDLLSPRYHVTESAGSLQIRLTRGYRALRIIFESCFVVAFIACVWAAQGLAVFGLIGLFRTLAGESLWMNGLMGGLMAGFLVLLLFVLDIDHVLKKLQRRQIPLGFRPLIFDRRSDRIIRGREVIGSLSGAETIVCMGYEGARGLYFVSIVFLDDADRTLALESYSRGPDEAGAFARRIAEFVGVPVVEPKKLGARANLVALADDALAGDPSLRGG